MSNSSADDLNPVPASIEHLVAQRGPMGDLRQFLIADLTPEEEDAFFAILGDA